MRHLLHPRSIAFRLIVGVVAAELIAAVAVICLSFGFERHTHFRAFDVMLHGRADSVLGSVQDAEDEADNVMLNQADLHLPPDDIYEVDDASGRLLGRSSNWQGVDKDIMASSHDGFFDLRVNSHHYHVLCFHGSRIVDPGEPGGGKIRQVTIFYGSPTGRVWKSIRGAVEFYAVGSLLLLLVSGPLIAWLLHRGLLPLRQLATLAALVSVDSWQFSPPASARSTPELAPLTKAIESVVERLERSFRQQKVFVSDAAHELKTAVAVLKSSLQLLGIKRRTAQEYQAGLERCLADCLRLEEIVAKMLTLARVESAAVAPLHQPAADMAECLLQVVAQLETFAALRNIHVSLATPPNAPCPVSIGAEDCSLALSNLLLNALQHSSPESDIELRLVNDGTTAELEIEDHGEGIDSLALPHVFDRFYRGDPSRTSSTGGTGLGLAIAKAVIERAGGSIAIASQLGQGTTVTVRLPLAKEIVPHSSPEPFSSG
jgi:signal transduction histidine kinase